MLRTDLENKRPSLFLLGLIAASSLTLTAFEWQYPDDMRNSQTDLPGEDDLLIEVDMNDFIIEYERPKTKIIRPAATKKTNSFIISNEPIKKLEIGKRIEPLTSPLKKTKLNLEVKKTMSIPEPSGPVSVRNLAIHEMPYTRDCGTIKDDVERFQCTQIALKNHIARNFKIPSLRDSPNIPNSIKVSFVIDEYGLIKDIRSKQEVDEALLKEIETVFSGIPNMVPAASDGQRISVRFEIPLTLLRQ